MIADDRRKFCDCLRSYGNTLPRSPAILRSWSQTIAEDRTWLALKIVARYECVYSRNSKNFKDKHEKSNSWEKIGEKLNLPCLFMNIFRIQNQCFLRFCSWRCRRLRTKRRNKFVCSKISSSMSAMLFALIFPRAQCASTFDISAERNVWLQSALRSFAIVWKQLSLRSSGIHDRLRSYGNQPYEQFCKMVSLGLIGVV